MTREAKFKARTVETAFDVVITGAGISFDPPSLLPGAPQLAGAVWEAIRDSLPDHVGQALDEKVSRRLRDVRMEQFLELVTKPSTIPTSLVVDVYRLVGGAAFNTNHRRLPALRATQFTLNMDDLIEDAAAGSKVTHLHGAWDRPRSIRTTVAHYSHGLGRRLRREFSSAIRDKTVLVIGYSGRDTDVMPLIEANPPKRLVWVGPHISKWEYEVVQLRKRYDRGDFDAQHVFVPIEQYAGEYLPTLVPTVPSPDGHVAAVKPPDLLRRLRAETTEAQRMVAVGHLLVDLGLDVELNELLANERFAGGLEIQRRKLLARSAARIGSFGHARALLVDRPGRISEVVPWLRNATEIDALDRRLSDHPSDHIFWRMVLVASMAMPGSSFSRSRLLARVRRAKRLAVSGRTTKALRIFRRVTGGRRVGAALGYDSLVDALTWQADALKANGDIRDAEETAMKADRIGFYGNPSQAAFAKWKLAEIMALAGPAEGASPSAHGAAVIRNLARAIVLAEQAKNPDTLAWLHGTFAEYVAACNVSTARRHLEKAKRAREDAGLTAPFGHGYHLLQRAIVEIRAGDLSAAAELVREAQAAESQTRVPALRLQAAELAHQLEWRQDPRYPIASHLDEIATEYRDRGMTMSEARTRLDIAALQGNSPPAWVRREAKERGWNDVLRNVENAHIRYPVERGILL